MSFVVINAVTVSDESRDEFEERFAKRAGTVSGAAGFEAFELLKPLGDGRYLVYTRWRSQEDFDRWVQGPAFQHGHRQHEREGPVSSESALWSFDVVQHEEAS